MNQILRSIGSISHPRPNADVPRDRGSWVPHLPDDLAKSGWLSSPLGKTPLVFEAEKRKFHGMPRAWTRDHPVSPSLAGDLHALLKPHKAIFSDSRHIKHIARELDRRAMARLQTQAIDLHGRLAKDVSRMLGCKDETDVTDRVDTIIFGARAGFHVDATFWDSIFLTTLLSIESGVEFVMPDLSWKVPARLGSTFVFDGLQIHGLVRDGSAAEPCPYIALSSEVYLSHAALRRLKRRSQLTRAGTPIAYIDDSEFIDEFTGEVIREPEAA